MRKGWTRAGVQERVPRLLLQPLCGDAQALRAVSRPYEEGQARAYRRKLRHPVWCVSLRNDLRTVWFN